MSTNENAKIIWDFLRKKGLNEYAVAGLMGNLKAESNLNPMNLQNTYEKALGFTDATYTTAVDNGSYRNFTKDKAGYGLAQWTYWKRKQALFNYAKAKGASIGDLNMQLEFLWKELQEYKPVMKTLSAASSVLEASNAVLLKYEQPANQGESVQKKRASYGQAYYDEFAAKEEVKEEKRTDAGDCKTPAAQETYRNYTVRSGDTLWEISKKYLGSGMQWKKIAELNGIQGALIRSGQVLKIPAA